MAAALQRVRREGLQGSEWGLRPEVMPKVAFVQQLLAECRKAGEKLVGRGISEGKEESEARGDGAGAQGSVAYHPIHHHLQLSAVWIPHPALWLPLQPDPARKVYAHPAKSPCSYYCPGHLRPDPQGARHAGAELIPVPSTPCRASLPRRSSLPRRCRCSTPWRPWCAASTGTSWTRTGARGASTAAPRPGGGSRSWKTSTRTGASG